MVALLLLNLVILRRGEVYVPAGSYVPMRGGDRHPGITERRTHRLGARPAPIWNSICEPPHPPRIRSVGRLPSTEIGIGKEREGEIEKRGRR